MNSEQLNHELNIQMTPHNYVTLQGIRNEEAGLRAKFQFDKVVYID